MTDRKDQISKPSDGHITAKYQALSSPTDGNLEKYDQALRQKLATVPVRKKTTRVHIELNEEQQRKLNFLVEYHNYHYPNNPLSRTKYVRELTLRHIEESIKNLCPDKQWLDNTYE